jgi:hypothetical protein
MPQITQRRLRLHGTTESFDRPLLWIRRGLRVCMSRIGTRGSTKNPTVKSELAGVPTRGEGGAIAARPLQGRGGATAPFPSVPQGKRGPIARPKGEICGRATGPQGRLSELLLIIESTL